MASNNGRFEDLINIVPVDAQGDVMLVVKISDRRQHVQVSSKVLSLASDVFDRMFNSKFREGLAHHDSTSPILIPLLEDDGDALVVVCNALHYRKEATTEDISMEVLIKIAVLCDKYNMGNSLLS